MAETAKDTSAAISILIYSTSLANSQTGIIPYYRAEGKRKVSERRSYPRLPRAKKPATSSRSSRWNWTPLIS